MNIKRIIPILLFPIIISCENNTSDELIKNNIEDISELRIVMEFNNVSGLVLGNSVLCNGLEIGEIAEMTLSKDGQSVFVSAIIDEENKIPKGSKFYLKSVDILGTKAVDIIYSNTNEFYQNRDTVIGLQEEIDSTFFLDLKESTERLIKSTDSLVEQGVINKDSLINSMVEEFLN